MSWAVTGVVIAGAGLLSSGYMGMEAAGQQASANQQAALADARQMQANKEAAEFNAAVLEKNAQFVEEGKETIRTNYGLERRRLADTKKAYIGAARASSAAAGIDADFGSAQDIQDDTERGYQIDRSVLIKGEENDLRSADIDIFNYQTEAMLAKKQGAYYNGAGAAALRSAASAGRAGRTAQIGTLLSTGAQVASLWLPSPKPPLLGSHTRAG